MNNASGDQHYRFDTLQQAEEFEAGEEKFFGEERASNQDFVLHIKNRVARRKALRHAQAAEQSEDL